MMLNETYKHLDQDGEEMIQTRLVLAKISNSESVIMTSIKEVNSIGNVIFACNRGGLFLVCIERNIENPNIYSKVYQLALLDYRSEKLIKHTVRLLPEETDDRIIMNTILNGCFLRDNEILLSFNGSYGSSGVIIINVSYLLSKDEEVIYFTYLEHEMRVGLKNNNFSQEILFEREDEPECSSPLLNNAICYNLIDDILVLMTIEGISFVVKFKRSINESNEIEQLSFEKGVKYTKQYFKPRDSHPNHIITDFGYILNSERNSMCKVASVKGSTHIYCIRFIESRFLYCWILTETNKNGIVFKNPADLNEILDIL